MTTLDGAGTTAGDSGRAFLESIGAEVDRIYDDHRAGRLDLADDHRSVLAEARDALLEFGTDPDPAVTSRAGVLLGRIDDLLDSGRAAPVPAFGSPVRGFGWPADAGLQADTVASVAPAPVPAPVAAALPAPVEPQPAPAAAENDVLQFLAAFREAAAPAGPRPGETPIVVAAPVSAPGPSQVDPVPPPRSWAPPAPTTPTAAVPPAPWAPPAAVPPAPWAPPAGPLGVDVPAGRGPVPAGRRRLWERVAMASALAVTAAALSLVAVHDNDAAAKWRRLDQAQVQISATAAHQVQLANANIAQLNSEVKSLGGQLSSAQGQLSSVANQKEKAIDQTTVFRDLLAAAGQVANNLQGCIGATNQLDADVTSAVSSGNTGALASLQSEASAVAATCAQAQQGNNALQAAIQSAS